MRLTKTGYYADFVVYPALLAAFGWMALANSPAPRRWDWAFACGAGMFAWTLLEYLLHRHVLHRLAPFVRMHEQHHAHPNGLVGTPTWLSLCAFAGLFLPLWLETDADVAGGLVAGLMLGYLWYVTVHHAVHHMKAKPGSWLSGAKLRHALHHRGNRPCNFGVSLGLWDKVFGSKHPTP